MDRTLALVVGGISVAVVGGFVLLALAGKDTTALAVFLAGPTVSALVGALLVQRTARVGADVEVVKHQTNSLLTGALGTLGDKLDQAAADRTDLLTAVHLGPVAPTVSGHPTVTLPE